MRPVERHANSQISYIMEIHFQVLEALMQKRLGICTLDFIGPLDFDICHSRLVSAVPTSEALPALSTVEGTSGFPILYSVFCRSPNIPTFQYSSIPLFQPS